MIKEYEASFITSDGGNTFGCLPFSLSLCLEEDESVELGKKKNKTLQPRTLSTECKGCFAIQESQILLSWDAESQRTKDLTLESVVIQRKRVAEVRVEFEKRKIQHYKKHRPERVK